MGLLQGTSTVVQVASHWEAIEGLCEKLGGSATSMPKGHYKRALKALNQQADLKSCTSVADIQVSYKRAGKRKN